MTDPVDHALDRILYSPKAEIPADAPHHPNKLVPVPWPLDITPSYETYPFGDSSQPLPKVDAVIVTWTVAEWQALTDVLCGTVLAGGAKDTDYAHNFDSYRADLTHKSPAASARCLARVRLIGLNGVKNILLVHMMLHVATDGPNLPLRRLFGQIIDETDCERIITTGTGGGIGPAVQLGDVIVGDRCHFNCQKQFADAPFAHDSYSPNLVLMPPPEIDTPALVAANLGQLDSQRNPGSAWELQVGTIETTDFFAADFSDDHYGLRAYDPMALMVEMDDAVLGLCIADRMAAAKPCPQWAAVRNVSDPVGGPYSEAEARRLAEIYEKFGYWTSVPSVIVSYLMAIA
jgi:hypothetical protein